MNTGSDSFDQYRPLLFSIAYRMLGSAMDAEDMVQEAFLGWQEDAPDEVQSPKAYLAAVVTRLSIDHLRLAYVQRETYVGPWLPEPILGGVPAGIGDAISMTETLTIPFLVLLESLSPVERAVFLLHDVFEYEYAEIAHIVDKSEANCRQMVSRARDHIAARRPRFEVSSAQQQELIQQFIETCVNGDMDGLLALLDKDIVEWSDGGGKVTAARNPIFGPAKVARLLLGLFKKAPPGMTIGFLEINGQPGVVTYEPDGRPHNVTFVDIGDRCIRGIYTVVNPDKLTKIPALRVHNP